MISKQQALHIWIDAGFAVQEAREWMRHWGTDNAADEAWMAQEARLWHDCGFTAAQASEWDDSGDITSGLGLAIIGRVHGLGPNDDQGLCPGVLTLTGDDDDDLLAAFTLYGQQDRRSPLIRWAKSGLTDAQVLGYWHAGIPLVEALASAHDDDAVNVLAALNPTRCPLLRVAA